MKKHPFFLSLVFTIATSIGTMACAQDTTTHGFQGAGQPAHPSGQQANQPTNPSDQPPVPSTPTAPGQEQCAVRDDQSSICINDRVIDYRNATGFIQQIYDNYTAIVEYDDGTRNTMDIQYLAREVQCLYGFCTGDKVRDTEGAIGTITDLFENGQTEVMYANGEVFVDSLNELVAVQDPPVIIVHDWPTRPYPGTIYIPYPFPPAPAVYPCPWPYMYPYDYPYYGHRVIFGIFVGRPGYGCGHHEFPNYPYPGHGYPHNPNGPRPLPYPGHYPNGGIHVPGGGPVGGPGGYHPPAGQPGPYHPPVHVPGGGPIPNPGPHPGPNPGPHPGPNPGPHPGPNPGPHPGPNPGPHPGPGPAPHPNPGPAPHPGGGGHPGPAPHPGGGGGHGGGGGGHHHLNADDASTTDQQ